MLGFLVERIQCKFVFEKNLQLKNKLNKNTALWINLNGQD